MTAFVRRDLPADIDVFAGDFASQPLAFAHLLDAAPALDLTHVEVIREAPPDARLGTYFDGRHHHRHPDRSGRPRHSHPRPASGVGGADLPPWPHLPPDGAGGLPGHRAAHGADVIAPGPRNLITDVSGLRVGNAKDQTIRTGVTVLTAEAPFTASVHVMGGAPGTRETELLAPDRTVERVDAIVLSGGSAFGLDAAQGVTEGLRAQGRGFAVHGMTVPIVPAAIIFDLANGGAKDWTSSPYPALGRTAFEAASETFAIGSEGAGTGALIADLKGGLGSASAVWNGYTVGALVAANPRGAGDGGRRSAFPRRALRIRGRIRRPRPRAVLRPGPPAAHQTHRVRTGGHGDRHCRDRRGADQGAGRADGHHGP